MNGPPVIEIFTPQKKNSVVWTKKWLFYPSRLLREFEQKKILKFRCKILCEFWTILAKNHKNLKKRVFFKKWPFFWFFFNFLKKLVFFHFCIRELEGTKISYFSKYPIQIPTFWDFCEKTCVFFQFFWFFLKFCDFSTFAYRNSHFENSTF